MYKSFCTCIALSDDLLSTNIAFLLPVSLTNSLHDSTVPHQNWGDVFSICLIRLIVRWNSHSFAPGFLVLWKYVFRSSCKSLLFWNSFNISVILHMWKLSKATIISIPILSALPILFSSIWTVQIPRRFLIFPFRRYQK